MSNLRVVMGPRTSEDLLTRMARVAFRNFAKYLVDFFRSSRIDMEYIRKHVRVEGLENIDEAKKSGRGAILLSAHIGNWELGGAVLSVLGYPVNGVVLTHQNKKINEFFRKQRLSGKVAPIEIGMSLKSCYCILKDNGFLALLGDRDFSNNGLMANFFGSKAFIPRGPAAFSHRLRSPIVPCFMLRDGDSRYRLFIDKPIYPEKDHGVSGTSDSVKERERAAIENITGKVVAIIEKYVSRYPSQWYVFRKIWNNGTQNLRPDTIL